MLTNPFTPSEIASAPDDFFGRSEELRTLERSLNQGSVAIQGAIGIGKSSLLARARLMMEGFQSPDHRARSIVVTADKDVTTVDAAARMLLESLTSVDERHKINTVILPKVFEAKTQEVQRNFVPGRHLATLERLLDEEYRKGALYDNDLLLLAIDEVDKCPAAVAKLVRCIVTHTQHQGIKGVRFLLAGVSPYYEAMLTEDQGIARFVYKTITLAPMPVEEATDLLQSKLSLVAERASENEIQLEIHPDIIPRIVGLSGGHPHLLQLLGSYVVEHEEGDPDGKIDAADLVNSLRRICYEDRAQAYDSIIRNLDFEGRLDQLNTILNLAASSLPTRIPKHKAIAAVGKESVKWLVDHNVLSDTSDSRYGLIDEFLRIRLLLDDAEGPNQAKLERDLIRRVSFRRFKEAEISSDFADLRGRRWSSQGSRDELDDEVDQ